MGAEASVGYIAETFASNLRQRCMMPPRERNRLCSERWRRARGIGWRRPAQRPWLAEGISRSTWYRRRAKAREARADCLAVASVERTIERAESFAAQLSRDLERCAAAEKAHAAIIGELAKRLPPWAPNWLRCFPYASQSRFLGSILAQ